MSASRFIRDDRQLRWEALFGASKVFDRQSGARWQPLDGLREIAATITSKQEPWTATLTVKT